MIFHLNSILYDQRVSRKDLRTAVGAVDREIEASYVTREGIIPEETIVEIAVEYWMDRIILSPRRRNRWRRLLSVIPGIEQDIEQVLPAETGIEVEIVQEG